MQLKQRAAQIAAGRPANGLTLSLALRSQWWPGRESNPRHGDFQSPALPTELPGHTNTQDALKMRAPTWLSTDASLTIYGGKNKGLRPGSRIALRDLFRSHDLCVAADTVKRWHQNQRCVVSTMTKLFHRRCGKEWSAVSLRCRQRHAAISEEWDKGRGKATVMM